MKMGVRRVVAAAAVSAMAVLGGAASASAAQTVTEGHCDYDGPAGCTTYFQPTREAREGVMSWWNKGYRGDDYFAYKVRTCAVTFAGGLRGRG
ncbi:hypothetical protein AB0O91_38000 [Kitasatospora sp. NPDC089797]|uniref:hypothetical protein n=1 Tax=Kitasatospora sp. NPDC089797 TaxID=3155298 RepID=UPI003446A824